MRYPTGRLGPICTLNRTLGLRPLSAQLLRLRTPFATPASRQLCRVAGLDIDRFRQPDLVARGVALAIPASSSSRSLGPVLACALAARSARHGEQWRRRRQQCGGMVGMGKHSTVSFQAVAPAYPARSFPLASATCSMSRVCAGGTSARLNAIRLTAIRLTAIRLNASGAN